MLVTPSFLKYLIASAEAIPAYVPRKGSGTFSQSLLNPFTCTS